MKLKSGLVATVLIGLSSVAIAAPTNWVQTVTYNSETITMRLTKEALRGANFELWSQNAAGGYDVVTPVDERSYLGTVDGYPGAVSCGILLDSGTFKGAVYFERGATWFTVGTAVVETRALGYDTFSNFQYPAAPTVGVGQAGSTMYGYELGVDVDYDYFNTTSGGSTATAFEGIEYSVCVVRAIYMRDVLLRPYLGRVIIRATLAQDPYTGLTQGSYLDAVRLEWNNNHPDTNPDVVCGASPVKIGGGLAWVGVVGTSSGYSVNQCNGSGNFDVVFRHEMGHNWDCGHYVGGSPEGTGLMGGNAAGRFSGCEAYRVLNHRNNKLGILDNEGTYTAIELPPYASMDAAEFVQTVTSSVVFDVLANDHDANGQAVSLASFDSTSAHGGTVTLQGQNLVYTAPGAFLGTDYFTYTISDTAARTAMGVTIISVEPNDPLRLYLALDETAGTTAEDDSVFENHGTLSGTNFAGASVAGKYGNAINLDGVDDYVGVSNVKLSANTVTLTAWVKRGATQNDFAGILFDRTASASGLSVRSDGELRYHWNDSPSTYNWDPNLTPPADTWTFVALVIEPFRAIIHMDSGSGFESATNNLPHAPATFGTAYVGRDPSGSRYFNGAIDDVRIYNYSMSQAELQNVYAGGGAEGPNPFDGATDVASPEASWSHGATATAYEIYLGTNQTAVAGANTGSPEYQGSTATTEWVFDLQPNTAYYWRVDTVKASTTVAGEVWAFTTADQIFEAGLIAYWKLDEGTGSTAADSSINNNVGTLNGPAWAAGFDNGALSFDGVDDSVTFGTGPSLGGLSDLTLTAWIKTSSPTEQVILQQRNGGFNGQYAFRVLANGAVNFYIYGDGGYQYSFGTAATVNDGEWHFVAAVRDGEDGYIYIDGNPVPAASASGAIRNLNASIGVGMGRDIRDNNKPFNGLIDEAKIYDLAKSGQNLADIYNAYITGTNAPSWNTSPVNEIDATVGVAYSSTLADDASDPDGNSLTFSKVSGPTWLSVAPNGALSGTPATTNVGPNSWIVDVTDGTTSPVQETLNIMVTMSIDVANDSFELPGNAKQTNWEGVPGWSSDSVAADSGVETGQGATDGAWTGFLWGSDPAVWNLTTNVIVAGEAYALKIDAKDTGGGSSLRIRLYYDNAGVRSTVATLDAGVSGGMQQFVLQFNADDVPAAVGKRIGIELDNVVGGWVGFDHVRLTSVPPLGVPVAPLLSITGPVAGGTAVVISWTSETGQTYGVDTNSTLGSTNWNSFTSGIPGNGGTLTVTNIIGPDQTFYRVVTE